MDVEKCLRLLHIDGELIQISRLLNENGNKEIMDAEKFLRLLHIDEELIQISHLLNENRNKEIAARLNPLIDDLTRLITEMKNEKISC